MTAEYTIEHPLASGTFHFTSEIENRRYSLRASAEVKALLGFYEWRSTTTSTGRVSARGPRPRNYVFRFRSNEKQGLVRMRMPLRRAGDVVSRPPIQPSRGRVPVTAGHLRGALDPLSAILTITSRGGARGRNPCSGTIPIFDGKQRFNLVLSSKRQEQISGGRGHGLSRRAFVCGVRYRPVSGHKNNTETRYMASTRDIELWLVPTTRANLYVPYRIVIPTPVGAAYVSNRSVSVESRGREQVAFVY